MEYLGNKNILKLQKTAFFCSQRCPANVILKSYDWAKEQREQGNCIVCNNQSKIEKDVFEMLLKGGQPLVLFMLRGLKTRWNSDIMEAIKGDRLLIVGPCDINVNRISRKTAEYANSQIIEFSDKIIVAYKTPNGQLDRLLENIDFSLL